MFHLQDSDLSLYKTILFNLELLKNVEPLVLVLISTPKNEIYK
jgi:hypothetical protein